MPEKQEESRDKIARLQQLQQQIQALSMQKQTLQMQQAEIDNALNELKNVKSEKTYELIGNILINKQPTELTKSLNDKKDLLNMRTESIDKQLKKTTIKAQELQKEVMSEQGGAKPE